MTAEKANNLLAYSDFLGFEETFLNSYPNWFILDEKDAMIKKEYCDEYCINLYNYLTSHEVNIKAYIWFMHCEYFGNYLVDVFEKFTKHKERKEKIEKVINE